MFEWFQPFQQFMPFRYFLISGETTYTGFEVSDGAGGAEALMVDDEAGGFEAFEVRE